MSKRTKTKRSTYGIICPKANALTQMLGHLPKDGCDRHLAFISETPRVEIPPPWHTRELWDTFLQTGRALHNSCTGGDSASLSHRGMSEMGAHTDIDISSDTFSKAKPSRKIRSCGELRSY